MVNIIYGRTAIILHKVINLVVRLKNGETMKILSSKDFGKMLKEKRKALGYTQSFLSEVTGYSASFISELENGKATAELEKALHLANMLGLDIFVEERD